VETKKCMSVEDRTAQRRIFFSCIVVSSCIIVGLQIKDTVLAREIKKHLSLRVVHVHDVARVREIIIWINNT
jgi:hypothetical protein